MSYGNYPPGMSQRDWSHVNGEHLTDEEPEPVSDCCDALLLGSADAPVCCQCLKPCSTHTPEPDDYGIDQMDDDGGN